MSTRKRLSCLLAVVAACCLPSAAGAQILYFPADATIDYTIGDLVYVGKDNRNRNTSPSVSIVAAGDLHGMAFVYNSSQLHMNGGRARGGLTALDGSTVSINDGEVGSLVTGEEGTAPHKGGTILMTGGTAVNARIDRTGTLSLHGGSINGAVTLNRGSTLYLDKSALVSGNIQVSLESQAYISGGYALNGVSAISDGRVSITGGTIRNTVNADGVSTINVSGGTTTFVSASYAGTVNLSGSNPEILSAYDNGVINMTGGSAGRFSTHNTSKGNLYDGTVHGDVTAFDSSTINIYGGTIGGNINSYGTVNIYGGKKAATSLLRMAAAAGLPDLFAVDEGNVQLFGSGLSKTLLDPDVAYDGDGVSGFFSRYALSGVLSDGTDITGASLFVQNGTGADVVLINVVPEPRTYVLFGLGIVITLLATRRTGRGRKPHLATRCGVRAA